MMRQSRKKLSADTESVAVSSTERAVIVLEKVIAQLTGENHRLKEHCDKIEEEKKSLLQLIDHINTRRAFDPLKEK